MLSDGCKYETRESFKRLYLLMRRGGCTFHTKAIKAKEKGALGIIIMNDSNSVFLMTHLKGKDRDCGIPVLLVSRDSGIGLIQLLSKIVKGDLEMVIEKSEILEKAKSIVISGRQISNLKLVVESHEY